MKVCACTKNAQEMEFDLDTSADKSSLTPFTLITAIMFIGMLFFASQAHAAAPTATTNPATSVTATGATLNGAVNPSTKSTTVTFNYGLTTGYGSNATASQSPLAANSGLQSVSAAITGLTCNTLYHFRVSASNSSGTSNGADMTFTTSACPLPPTVTTSAATALTSSGATLNGTVSSNGTSTTVTFNYGLTTGYGSTVTATQSPLAGTAVNAAVSYSLTGLLCNTTYHFQASGTNSGGTTNGSDVAFTTSACPLVALYHMDESAWTGTSGQVIDSSGNGNNAQAFNSASTASATPAIAGNPGTCGYGVFDNGTTITAGYVQTPIGNLTSDFTVTAWINTNNNTFTGQRILEDDENNTGGYGFSLGDGAAGILRFFSRGIAPVILDSTYTIQNNTWYFVAASVNMTTKIRSIYVFSQAGALLAVTSDAAAGYTGTWGTDAGPVSIGGEVNGPPQTEPPATFHFHGNLDEVQVFSVALTQAQLAQYATQTHACPVSGPDHILITHDGNGLTCTPETLTVTACANAACTSNYTAAAVTGVITWSGAPGGTVPFNITTNGTTTVGLPVTTPQTVILGASAVNPAANNLTTCWNSGTATASCSLPFASAGLLFSSPNNLVSGSSQNITISAVRASNQALNCVPAFANVSRTINLKCSYSNPGSGTLPALVAGFALNSGNNAASACDATGQSPSLSFNASGVATTTLQYNDVGQLALNATYTGSSGTGDSGLSMTGSGSFVAAPASFGFSGITAAPIKAGNNFAATVTAKNSLGNATANFGKESSPEGVTLTFSKCQPTGTNSSNGTFSGSVGTFAGGAANATNLNWSEVGNGDLVATLASGSYLGSGLTATGNTGTGGTVCNGAGNVGRFIPDHFDTVVTPGMPCPTALNSCPTLNNPHDQGFVYSGQAFTTNVYARNAVGVTTVNYDGTTNTSPNFAQAVTLYAWDAPGSTTTNNPPAASGSSLGSSTINYTSFSQGTTTLTPATPSYTFGTTPTAPTNIYIRATDADATSQRGASSVEGGIMVVSGRVYIANAYGSELLQLPLTATVQYWNSTTGWVTSTTDSVTQFNTNLSTAGGNIVASIVNGLGSGVSVVSPKGVTVSAGVAPFTLSPTGVAGSANISLNAPGYLLGGSNGAAVNPSNPGRATFGVYKAPSEFIYLRENY